MKNFTFLFLFIIISNFISAQQWREADQPEGGEIISIDVSPLDTTKIVLVIRKYVEMSIWYSKDAGESWRKINTAQHHPGDVKIDPVNNRIYANIWGRLIVTTDEGVSWDTLFASQNPIEGLDYNPADPSEIFFMNPEGIYRSSNFGEDWSLQFAHSYSPSSRKFNWSPHDTNHVIVAEYSGMLKSSDKGITWTEIPTQFGQAIILFDPLQDSVLFKKVSNEDSIWAIRSTDYGTSWSYFPGFIYYSTEISYLENGAAAFLSYNRFGIQKTLDYGVTWQQISQPVKSSLVYYNGINFYACFPSIGFAVYKGGDVWEYRNKGIKEHNFYSITITDSYTFLSNIFNTFRKSNSAPAGEWESIRPDSLLQDICFYNDSIGFGRDGWYDIFQTTNGGNSWQHLHDFFSIGQIEHLEIAGDWLFAAVTDYGGDNGLYRLPIGQSSWTKVLDGYNTRVMIDSGSVYGFDSYNPEKLKKSFYGANWTNFADVQTGLAYYAFSPKLNPAGFLLGGTTDFGEPDQGILYFIDETGNRITLNSGKGIFSAAAPAGRNEYYFITTQQSIIYKADSIGGEPYQFDEGIPVVPEGQGKSKLFYFNVPGYQDKIYTIRIGLWVLDVDEVTGSDELVEQFNFSLEQNYPNPFNPATVIRYSLPLQSKVELKIYDILGKEIVQLVNEEQRAGVHNVKWNAAGYPSGVYFCRLKAGSFTKLTKMMLIK